MKIFRSAVLSFTLLLAIFCGAADIPATLTVDGSTDRDRAVYAPGEQMTFTIRVNDNGEPVKEAYLKWLRDGDDGVKENGLARVTPDQPLVVTTSLDRPGFVRVNARLSDSDGNALIRTEANGRKKAVEFDGGAGVEIEKITQAVPEPEDFDAYWARQKERLAATPITAERKQVDSKVPGINLYEVTVNCAGPRPVTGYLAIPEGAKPKSLPARLFYYGYNDGPPYFPSPNQLKDNRIAFFVNAHGFKLNQDRAYYSEFAKSIRDGKYSYAFSPRENADPDTAYFNGMALRVMRSLQYVKTLPEWNGRDLVADGYSQGGLQAVWAAGLDPDVTLCRADIPWCCDLGGITAGRAVGDWRLEYVPGLNYYDTVNHIKRAKCPLEIPRAGLGDYICPPSGVTILYNNAPNAKRINYVQGSTHSFVPRGAKRFTVESGTIPTLP